MTTDWPALIVSFISLVVAVIALRYTYRSDNEETARNTAILRQNLRLDFSRRYQDLMTAMPEGLEFTKKFALLYFDLCAEEYRLHQESPDMIGSYTWDLWQEGMEDTLQNHPELATLWKEHRNNYGSTNGTETESFQTFFDDLVSKTVNHASQSE